MEIITVGEKEKWNRIVTGFSGWDIYYLNEYAYSLQIHSDGVPCLIYHEKNGSRICYVMMQKDIADFQPLESSIQKGEYFDWSVPYGYGGPLTEGLISAEWISDFIEELTFWCKNHNVVSQFFRFHPLLQNQKILESVCDVIYMKKTVYIDTSEKEAIFKNMTPNNRNMVRKALKNEIEIVTDRGGWIEDFRNIYETTMKNNGADAYYYFEKEYFDYLLNEMNQNLIFFYALYQGKPVSASMFFFNTEYMHYHLSGTLPEYKNLAATNLLLSKAADWAAEHGIKKFHLGGGVGTEDSLFKFKKHFNRNGLLDFCIGRTIFNKESFDYLTELRKKNDAEFNEEAPYLIKYRAQA